MTRRDELDRLAATHASRLAEGDDDIRGLAEQVHRVLGPHAVAAVDTLDLQAASALSRLHGIGLDHWEVYGVGAAPRDAEGVVVAVVYGKRNAWNGTREERRKLRDGIASFQEAFKRLYGKNAEWTLRWKTGQDSAFEPLLAAATSASGLTGDAFDQNVSQDPLLQWQLRKFLVDWALDADFAEQRAKGAQTRESAGARGRPLPMDL